MEEVFACNACIVILCSHIRREKPAAHNVIPIVPRIHTASVPSLLSHPTTFTTTLAHTPLAATNAFFTTCFYADTKCYKLPCRLYYQKPFVLFFSKIFSRTSFLCSSIFSSDVHHSLWKLQKCLILANDFTVAHKCLNFCAKMNWNGNFEFSHQNLWHENSNLELRFFSEMRCFWYDFQTVCKKKKTEHHQCLQILSR